MLSNLAYLVIVIAGLHYASSVATLFLVALFVAVVSAPAVLWLERRKIPATAAAMLVIGALVATFGGMGALVGASINGFVAAAPLYRNRLDQQMQIGLQWLRERGLEAYGLDLLESIEPGSVMSLVGTVMGALGGLIGNGLIILLVVTFILLEVPGMRAKFLAAFPGSPDSLGRFSRIAGLVERYLILKTVLSVATGFFAGIWVAVLGVDFALLWGLLAFLLNYIPNFGSVIAAVPPILLALIQFGVTKAALVAAGYLVVNFVFGNVLEPKLMGRSMGLSTLMAFLSLLAWGGILGMAGMFLAVPLTMALRIVLDSEPSTRWLAVLMGPGEEASIPGSPPPESSESAAAGPPAAAA